MKFIGFLFGLFKRRANVSETATQELPPPPQEATAVTDTPPIENRGADSAPEAPNKPARVSSEYDWHSDEPIYYAFVHKDSAGTVFYAGLGVDDSAWQPKTDIWQRYVEERSNGKFEVEIVAEDLSHMAADRKKDALLRKHWKTLVNIQNPYRPIDFEENARFHRLRNENRAFCAETRKSFESDKPDEAIDRYRDALERMHEYAEIKFDSGVFAEFAPRQSEIEILDRLTLCLAKQRRHQELIDATERYFDRYPRDINATKKGDAIVKRVERSKKALRT